MSSTTANPRSDALSSLEVMGIWCLHLASLIFPLTALAFLLTGPHPWYIAPLFLIPMGVVFHLDTRPKTERRQPSEALPAWPFDAIVYTLAGLQFVVVYQTAVMFSQQAIFSVDMFMVFALVGANSGFSIITAHELIHRRKSWEQQLGRALLATVLYEHFYTEHLRGHHPRVGTEEDPATARFGETYREFWKRTVPGQFRSAWKLEAQRLGDENMSLFDARMLHNRILHGIAVGWGLAFAILGVFGVASFVAHLLQAFLAVRLLEAVNYFEHWGLRRRGARVRPMDSWDTYSWFTYYGLVGLSRHADHHAYPTRPYQALRVWDEAPLLPQGYVGLVDMVLMQNDEFRRLATEELRRRRLGPFAEDEADEQALIEQGAGERDHVIWTVRLARFFTRPLRRLPSWAQGATLALGVIAVLSFGGQIETGTLAGYGMLFLRNLWIIGAFAVMFAVHRLTQRVIPNEAVAWGTAFTVLIVLGRASTPFIGQ